ncbi:MAG: glycosyltransferase family 9 protein [bacterium]
MATSNNIFGKYLHDSQEFEAELERLEALDRITYVVTKIGGIGDTFASLPVIRAIQNHWPESRGWFIVDGGMPLDGLFADESFDLIEISRGTGITGVYKQYRDIRKTLPEQPDIYIDLTQSPRGFYYALFSRAKLKLGFKWHSFHKWVLDAAVDRSYTKFEGDTFMDVPRMLGIERNLTEPSYQPADHTLEDYKRWKQASNLGDNENFLLLNPGARTDRKRWSKEKWPELIKLLDRIYDGKYVLLEGPAEKGITSVIDAKLPDDLSAKVETNVCRPLGEVTHLANDAEGILTNDTYLLHIGLTLGAPTFCIFNGKDPFRYRFTAGPHDCCFDLRTSRPDVKMVSTDVRGWLEDTGII